MISLPFSLPDVYEGLAEVEGIARYEKNTLWLEFQTKDSFFGVLKGEVKQVALPAQDLEEVRLKHRMFRSHLILRARSLSTVAAIPGSKVAEVKLMFKRGYRDNVESLCSSLALAISEAKLARLDEEEDRLDI